MYVQRIGLVPNVDDPGTEQFYRSALILSAEPHKLRKWCFAPCSHLGVDAQVLRLPPINCAVFWGSSENKLAKLLSSPAALTVVIVPEEPKAGGALLQKAEEVAKQGVDIHFLVYKKGAPVRGVDVGGGRSFIATADLSKSPQVVRLAPAPKPEAKPKPKPKPAPAKKPAAAEAPPKPAPKPQSSEEGE